MLVFLSNIIPILIYDIKSVRMTLLCLLCDYFGAKEKFLMHAITERTLTLVDVWLSSPCRWL